MQGGAGVPAETFRAADADARKCQAHELTCGQSGRSRWSCSTKDHFAANGTARVPAASLVRASMTGRCTASRVGPRAVGQSVARPDSETVPYRQARLGSIGFRWRSHRDRSQLGPCLAQRRRRAGAHRMPRRSNTSLACGAKLPSQLEHVKGGLIGRWKNATRRAGELQGIAEGSSITRSPNRTSRVLVRLNRSEFDQDSLPLVRVLRGGKRSDTATLARGSMCETRDSGD